MVEAGRAFLALQRLRSHGIFCDLKFVIHEEEQEIVSDSNISNRGAPETNSREIDAHCCVVASKSPVLQAMMGGKKSVWDCMY